MKKAWILTGLAALATTTLAQTQLWNFTDHLVNIENSALRPNGDLLLSTFDNGSFYSLDPSAASPKAELVAQLPGATGICGIAITGPDQFAIVGGIRGSYNYTNETVYTLDYSGNTSTPSITPVVTIPNAILLNGMAALPANPRTLLAGDSRQGAVFRIDLDSRSSEIAFADPLFTPTANATVPIGINGLKIFGGYIYFTNTARYLFGRVPITEAGDRAGDIEVLVQLDPSSGIGFDDLFVGADGVVYLAQTPNAVARYVPGVSNGTLEVIAGGGGSTFLKRPTSVAVVPGAKTGYVTTGGTTVNNVTYSGQVVEFAVPSFKC